MITTTKKIMKSISYEKYEFYGPLRSITLQRLKYKTKGFNSQEDLHPVILKSHKIFTNIKSNANTMHMQFPNSFLLLNPTREKTRVETLPTHTNPW